MTAPLEGVKVVDFSRVLAGPLCGRTLQDLGAHVTKIEPPRGDVSRLAAPLNLNGVTGYYAQQNAGKRALSIDLNKAEAKDVAWKLVEEADILVENFRPGTLAAFGFDYESVAKRNPRLIYVSISGYGQGGPWRGRMAYAPTVHAEAGFTHHTLRHFGDLLSAPKTDALSHADAYVGLQGVIAVLAALHQRDRTGVGQHIDVAMAATMLAVNEHAHVDLNGLDPGDDPAILGATDGSFFTGPKGERFFCAISPVSAMTFSWYIAAMRRPDLLEDPRFVTSALRSTHRAQFEEIIQKWIWTFADMASLDAHLDQAKLAIGEVRTVEQLAASEWADYWGATLNVPDRQGGEFRLPGRPWKFSGAELPTPGAPSEQGEQNDEICRELGYNDADIARMRDSGALVGNFVSQMIAMVGAQTAERAARHVGEANDRHV